MLANPPTRANMAHMASMRDQRNKREGYVARSKSGSLRRGCALQSGWEGAMSGRAVLMLIDALLAREDLDEKTWWRRRESNPRPRAARAERLRA